MGIKVVNASDAGELIQGLQSAGYGVTMLEGQGTTGQVKMIYTALPRKDLDQALSIIRSCQPGAFCTVQELQSAEAGIFPKRRRGGLQILSRLVPPLRGIGSGFWQAAACSKEEAVVAEQG